MTYKINYSKLIKFMFLLLLFIVGMVYGIKTVIDSFYPKNSTDDSQTIYEVPNISGSFNTGYREYEDLYKKDDDGSIKYLYITVFDEDINRGYDSFSTVNNYTGTYGVFESEKPKSRVLFQEGDENGPKFGAFGYSENDPNAILEVRGMSSSRTAFKSYKVSLGENSGLWRDQKVINLNKHPYEFTKMRNKLSFDLFEEISDIGSLRTQFVQVFIKDLSKGKQAGFIDYGLFTQIEQVNKKYLKMHGLDSNGSLYKASNFEFYRYPGEIEEISNPIYDENKFNGRLEIKGSSDHKKLIQMLDDINDYTIDINEVIDKHFNRDNYLTWLACNILFENTDVISQNFYLYSPTNLDTWYFIPWDYDDAWAYSEQEESTQNEYSKWQKGIQKFWGTPLHRRFLTDENNLSDLENKLDELLLTINENKIESQIDKYYPIVSYQVSKSPDITALGTSLDNFSREVKKLITLPKRYREDFNISKEEPMPVYMAPPIKVNDGYEFSWDVSYDLQGDEIYYDFYLSQSPNFNVSISQELDLKVPTAHVDNLKPGIYYYKVEIRDSKGNTMNPFDTFIDLEGNSYFGVVEFTVK